MGLEPPSPGALATNESLKYWAPKVLREASGWEGVLRAHPSGLEPWGAGRGSSPWKRRTLLG